MTYTVQNAFDWLNSIAPFETAESFDNVGLLIGSRSQAVSSILVALDCTLSVVDEAVGRGANLIISHHPLFYHARKHLREEDPEARVICALIRNHISLLSAHTNLDRAPRGINDTLGNLFSLQSMQGEGYLRCGRLPTPLPASELTAAASRLLHAPVRLYGPKDACVETLAVGSGAYGEGYEEAKRLGAQAFLTGEVHHHEAVAAAMEGIILLEAGHYATEAPGMWALAEGLQTALNGLQYNVVVYRSAQEPYPGALLT